LLKLPKALSLILLSAFLLTLCSACITIVTQPTSSNSINENFRKTLKFSNQALDLNKLVCNYGPEVFQARGYTQVKTTVVGSGARPEELIVTRFLGSQPKSGALPSITSEAGWQARGNVLNCSILNCPSGTYSVALRYAQGSSCPDSIILELNVL